jgi:protein-tyrosine phosphatase
VIDLHTHLLFGLDDGPQTIEESLELAAAMVAEGVTIAACTPHVRDDHDTTPETMEAALAELRVRLDAERIPLDVRGGGEIALDKLGALDGDTLARFGLGGNPKLVLLEFPYYGWPLALPSIVAEMRANGIVPVLAHPERNSEVQENPERLRPLVEAGAYVQITADSVGGDAGPRPARCAKALLQGGLAHLLASDWHGGTIRRAGLRSGARAAGGEQLADWLTALVPGALLAGALPPPRPPARGRRPWRRG